MKIIKWLILIMLASYFGYYIYQNRDIEYNKKLWISGGLEIRERMIDDIIEHKLKKGMTSREVMELLGEGHSSKLEIWYYIMEDFGWDIDPVETKILSISFSPDSVVTSYQINHWKK
ncbi:outer membrane protein assembly factor BamE [Halosquirtibacter xylanolyticus]|uniref:outer membrane protein assembly factor BamE domain-containing protein n=1 Tax=Halosquirtibacter xylanolyticus TaxID=3374599 RepID=UPI0037487915|nr:outer membrane protein assembly factor BamE [Prolixibacteraceae bacterium]